jgi:hypothetical protein
LLIFWQNIADKKKRGGSAPTVSKVSEAAPARKVSGR